MAVTFFNNIPKEKSSTLCSDSIDNSELRNSISTDFIDFMSKVTPIIGKIYFGSMEYITFCKTCSIEIKNHFFMNTLIQRNTEILKFFFTRNCRTYCEVCNKVVRNDVWREPFFSENHLGIELKNYCKVCNTRYDVSEYLGNFQTKGSSAEHNHKLINTSEENQERFDCCSS